MNRFRGEAEIEISGKKYAVAMNLGTLADMATKLGVKTFAELQDRMFQLTDLPTIVDALLSSNGHTVAMVDIRRLDLATYMDEVLPAIFRRKDEAADENPPTAPAKK